MALLPAEVDVGTRLHYEMFSYTIIEQSRPPPPPVLHLLILINAGSNPMGHT